MLFNSLIFLYLFLPATLVGFGLVIRLTGRRFVHAYLCLVSILFYGAWNPANVPIIFVSVVCNYGFATGIARQRGTRGGGRLLALGVVFNLVALAYFKYANFLVDNVNGIAGTDWTIRHVILPLAISFFTFQQIAYIVDVSRGQARPDGLLRYATFVLFFPKVMQGPIVHYSEIMPQIDGRRPGRFFASQFVIGLTIFALGLFKKTVIADLAGVYATPIFNAAHAGVHIGMRDAWIAGITYTFQLYFDFSGYSDMAVGVARMFGVKLPPNFHSPLRAASIIDYWRRWHMTLQQFIVSYMYQPIVLPVTRFASRFGLGKWPLFVATVALPTTMVFMLVGLWHGAGWTFILFGVIHGIYLSINEFWQTFRRKARRKHGQPGVAMTNLYRAITLVAVVFANVLFRSATVTEASRIWAGMFRLTELAQWSAAMPRSVAECITKPLPFILAATAITALMPNTQQFMRLYHPVYNWKAWRHVAPPVLSLTWRPTLPWALGIAFVLFLGATFVTRGQTGFIYLNF